MEKQCTLSDWQEYYRRTLPDRLALREDRFQCRGNDSAVVIQRGPWSRSSVFSRCKFCDGLKVYGICQACGAATACSKCRRVIVEDGKTLGPAPENEKISHGLCTECFVECQKDLIEFTHRRAN